jgi:hypothetical protein
VYRSVPVAGAAATAAAAAGETEEEESILMRAEVGVGPLEFGPR